MRIIVAFALSVLSACSYIPKGIIPDNIVNIDPTKPEIPTLNVTNGDYVIPSQYFVATLVNLNNSTLIVDKDYTTMIGLVIVCTGNNSRPAIEVKAKHVALEYSFIYGCQNYLKHDTGTCEVGGVCAPTKAQDVIMKQNFIQPTVWLK